MNVIALSETILKILTRLNKIIAYNSFHMPLQTQGPTQQKREERSTLESLRARKGHQVLLGVHGFFFLISFPPMQPQ